MAKLKLPCEMEYQDELNDDFAGITRKRIRVGADFPFIRKSRLWNLTAAVVYRGIMTPFAYLYCKLVLRMRIVGKEKLKAVGQGGCFIYGNHTLMAGDAFLPSMVSFPKRTYVVVNADNLSVRFTQNWIQMSGALPVPTEPRGMRAFLSAMETRVQEGHCIMIYPEAHIWPYYTGIRPFGRDSFRYPVRFGCPVFCTTVTYSKKRFGKKPRVTVYVDGPFEADKSLPPRMCEQALRDEIYAAMCRRAAENNTYAPITYKPKKEADA